MKVFLPTLLFLALSSLLLFCKHQPKFTPDTLPSQQLRWGSGGGFVGKETAYTLVSNGQIFRREMAGALTEFGKTKPKKAAAVIKTAQSLGISTLNFVHPGNVYSFLEWKEGDTVRRITWGDPKFPVDAGVKALYDQLNGLLKK